VLAEASCWCSKQSLSAESQETPDLLRRRRLVDEAGRLLASVSRQGSYESREWQRALEMFKEADPDSIAPLEYQLRSPDLKPSSSLGETDSEETCRAVVADVIARRSRLLSSRYGFEAGMGDLDSPGRLLIYAPCENVSDGASKYASKGFCDEYDAPPWDSWLHYSNCELISWVPAVPIPLAQDAIDANAVGCIKWAT
jgi:hypothetical protein